MNVHFIKKKLTHARTRNNNFFEKTIMRNILLSIAFLLLLHPLLIGLFRNVRYSLFFSSSADFAHLQQEYERELRLSERAVERRLRLQQLRDIDDSSGSSSQNASLCVAIASVPRGSGHRYLTLLVGSLLRGSTLDEIESTRFVIVTRSAAAHDEARHIAELDNFELIETSPDDDAKSIHNDNNMLLPQWVSNQQKDYLDAMNVCLEHAKRVDAPYYVVLEDDGLLANHFIQRIHSGVSSIVDKHDWFIVKLFLTDYYAGWSGSRRDILTLLLPGGIVGVIVAIVSLRLSLRKNLLQLIFWFIYSSYIGLIVLLAIGK
jgi:hypothetical protein